MWTLDRDPPSYFFGTIHVPYTRVWDYIPLSTKNAFRYSENVYLELDLTDSSTATALATCQLLPERKTIDEFVPNRLYRRLTRYMDYIRRKIPDWMGDEKNSVNAGYRAEYQYKLVDVIIRYYGFLFVTMFSFLSRCVCLSQECALLFVAV